MSDYDAIIIGAGLGGLSTGSIIAKNGMKVLVLEQSDIIGGCCSTFENQGYKFDVGASIVELIRPLEILFEKMGKDIKDYVDLIPCDPIYSFITPEGKRFKIPTDIDATNEVVKAMAPEDYENWLKFEEFGMWLLHYGLDAMICADMSTFSSALKVVAKYPKVYKMLPTLAMNHEMAVKKAFSNKDLLSSVSFQSFFAGAPPFLGSGVFGMIALSEHLGIYYPRGGMKGIPDGIMKAGQESGMEVRTNTKVERILLEGRDAKGVVLDDGTEITSDIVVSNVNGKVTYLKMIGPDALPKWAFKGVTSYMNSMPCPMLYVGLDTKPNLNAHHTIVTGSVEFMNEVWTKYYTQGLIPENAMSLICWPTEADPSLAPEGHHVLNWICNAPAPYSPLGDNWDRIKDWYKEQGLKELEKYVLPDARDHVTLIDVSTPLDFERRLLHPEGGIYGLFSDLTSLAMFRMSNKSRAIKDLYLSGASTHFGGGVPTSVASGITTADIIMKDHG
ncbi:MAG: NAD(P)/FAD-dependent oxidoreductase [Actinobacteria bacterium]|nr:NAD(P)/FAD-dependent oxidoreductase [Actinomycetota bacterium]